jgi:transmembrane sensor
MSNGTPNAGQPDGPVDWDALARYLAGESPAEEASAMRQWIAEDAARENLVSTLNRSIDRLAFRAPAGLDVEGALARVSARLDLPAASTPPAQARAPLPRGWAAGWGVPVLRAVAMVVLLVGGAVFFWQATQQQQDGRSLMASAQTFATAVGERDSLGLPDGTSVLLGPGSALTVAAGYGKERREVELRGDALFDVPHDEARPFVVRAGAAAIRDLGTAFTVQTDDDGRVRVVVTSGAVVLHAAGTPEAAGAVLRQGDRGMLQEGGHAAVQRTAVTEDDLAWTRGRIVFSNAPLAQVSATLRRWFGIELRVADPALADRHLTASFTGESPEQVLKVIALALGAEVEMRGDTAVVRAAGAGTALP